MQAKLICHICNFILLVCSLLDDLQTGEGNLRIGVGEARFAESALEDFHEAVSICVVVNRGAFAGCPYENELRKPKLSVYE